MKAERELAAAFVELHPDEAARLAEAAPAAETVELLGRSKVQAAAALLTSMDPHAGGNCLSGHAPQAAAETLAAIPPQAAARILRTRSADEARSLVARLPAERRELLERLLPYAEGTVGSAMDPAAFTLPGDVGTGEAQRRIRRESARVRYYVFVVDRSGALVGVVNLRELLLAPADRAVGEIVRPVGERLAPQAPLSVAANHPGWRRFRSLPVVDEENRFVGVLSLDELRRTERDRAQPAARVPTVGIGLAHLFWTLQGALLDRLVATVRRGPVGGER